jgi:hypothetical protein
VGLWRIDDEEMSHQLKEMISSKEYNLVVDAEKEKELKFNVAPGESSQRSIFGTESHPSECLRYNFE